MKNRSLVALISLVLAVSLCSSAFGYKKIKCFMPQTPEIDLNGVKQVAVLDFSGSDQLSKEAGKFLADKMIEYMLMDKRGITQIQGGLFGSPKEGRTLIEGVGTNVFQIVERSRLTSVMAEQSIGQAGLISEAEAAQIGALIGAGVMISGSITDSRDAARSTEVHETYRDKQKVSYQVKCVTTTVQVTANVRIVNSTTGQILATRQASRKVTDKVCEDSNKKQRDAGEMAGECCASIAWEFCNLVNPWYELEEFELDKVKAEEFKKEADEAADAAEKYELAKAYAVFDKLYQSDNYNPQFLYNMGILYEVTGDFDKSKEMYDGASQLKDEKDYKTAAARIARRQRLVPFYASLDMAIKPLNFAVAAADKSLTAHRIKVKGGSKDRIDVFAEANTGSTSVAKVPGEIQLEVIAQEGDWYLVKLLGGKQGYIHKDYTKE